jgi:hypothetical protein
LVCAHKPPPASRSKFSTQKTPPAFNYRISDDAKSPQNKSSFLIFFLTKDFLVFQRRELYFFFIVRIYAPAEQEINYHEGEFLWSMSGFDRRVSMGNFKFHNAVDVWWIVSLVQCLMGNLVAGAFFSINF